jgi:hypothetical protein
MDGRTWPRALATAWLLAAACSSDSLDEPSSEQGGSAGSAGLAGSGSETPSFGESECGQCVATECSAERSVCSAEPGCASYVSCLEACPVAGGGDVESVCEAACSRPEAGAAKSALDDYVACRKGASCAACASPATGAGGSPGGTGILGQQCEPSPLANACLKCIAESCCDTEAAYDGSSAAQELDDCVDACEDVPCQQTCFEQWPAEAQTVLDHDACNAMKCGTPEACSSSDGLLCLITHCADLYVDCYADLACFMLKECRLACNLDSACTDACDEAAPASAVAKYERYGLCLSNECPPD